MEKPQALRPAIADLVAIYTVEIHKAVQDQAEGYRVISFFDDVTWVMDIVRKLCTATSAAPVKIIPCSPLSTLRLCTPATLD